MSALLTGKVSRLIARLGTPASSTIAAKLDTLHDTRITSARAANLDKLDGNISAIAAGGKHRAVQILTGSGNWAHPANVKDNLIEVTLVGGGSAGSRLSGAGNGGSGGNSGQIIVRMPFVLSGASTAYSVGAAAAGRATDGTGAAGNDTTFGLLRAAGGTAPLASSSTPSPGTDGTLDGVLNRFDGATGGQGANDGGSDGKAGGNYRGTGGIASAGSGGGGAGWGNGGNAVTTGGAGADAPANSGAGGGGCNTGTSGAGGSGYILIEYEEASTGGGGGGGSVFTDDIFRVTDDADPTKAVAFEVSGVATGTTRTVTMPDGDVDLGRLLNAAIRVVSGTSDTLLASDAGKVVIYTNAAAIAVTLPDTFAINFHCTVVRAGAGVPTVTRSGTDTINGAATGVAPSAQWKGMYLAQYAAGTYLALL